MIARYALLIAVAVVSLSHDARAQSRRAPPARPPAAGATGKTPCVDVVSLRQGKPAKGLIIASQGEHVLMAVERQVLSQDNAELYERASQSERGQAEKAWTQLRDRLRPKLEAAQVDKESQNGAAPQAPLGSPAERSLFERELARAEQELEWLAAHPDEPLATRFLWLDLSPREIQSVKRASPEAQRIAVWAWSEGVKEVSARDRADLERELADQKIDARQEPPDLSHLLAPREQSDDEWAARLAIVHYALDTPLDFQGSNGVFVETGADAGPVDLAPLIQKMMAGNLEALLADLDPAARKASGAGQTDEWAKALVPRAEQAQRTEFRATRLDPDASGRTATVETAFVTKLPTKGWHVVWSARHTTAADEVNAEAEQQIAEDPQVKTALGLLSALGAGGAEEIKKAVRFGAATMAAQKAAQSQFFQFRDRYIRRLDGPPL